MCGGFEEEGAFPEAVMARHNPSWNMLFDTVRTVTTIFHGLLIFSIKERWILLVWLKLKLTIIHSILKIYDLDYFKIFHNSQSYLIIALR